MSTVLIIGSTGQVGRVVVEEALGRGHTVKAQTRNAGRARQTLPDGIEVIEASPTSPDDLRPVVADVDAVVLTHGGDMDGEGGISFYTTVAALLDALEGNNAHVSLMTSMNVSRPESYGGFQFMAWKRRAERLVRVSGHPYTIVRPGWFDYQSSEDRRIDLRQGDQVTGQPGADRHHIAQVLLEGFANPSGARRTVEVFSAPGSPVTDFEALFSATRADVPGSLDGVLDTTDVPLEEEPERLQNDIARFSR